MSSDNSHRDTEQVVLPPDVDNGADAGAPPYEEAHAVEEQEPAEADAGATPYEEAHAVEEQEPADVDADATPYEEAQAVEEHEPADVDADATPYEEAHAVEEHEPADVDADATPYEEAHAVEEQEPAEADAGATPYEEAHAVEEQEPAEADADATPYEEAHAVEEQEPAEADADATPYEEAHAVEEQEPADIDADATPYEEAHAVEEHEPADVDAGATPYEEAHAVEEQEPADIDADATPYEEAHAVEEHEPADVDADATPYEEAQAVEEHEPADVDADATPYEEAHAVEEQEPADIDADATPYEEAHAVEEHEPADVDADATPYEEAHAVEEHEPADVDADATPYEEAHAVEEHEPADVDADATPYEEAHAVEEHEPAAIDGGAGVREDAEPPVEALDRGVDERAEGDAVEEAEANMPSLGKTEGKEQDNTSSPETISELRKPSPPSHDLLRRQASQQFPRRQWQSQQEQQHLPASMPHRGRTPPAPSMEPYATTAGVDGVYGLPEVERIAIASASLTPNNALVVFRRGHENSHVNRMEIGSYSRYLLSTDYMSPPVLEDTFHGAKSTVGTVPRNTLTRYNRGNISGADVNNNNIAPRARSARHQSPIAAASVASSAHHIQRSPRSAFSASRPTMSDSFGGTAASSTNLRREIDMLGDAHLPVLNTLRQQRRRDPRHGKSTEEQRDYVYYNHRSKGFYVPHDPPADTVMLQYNHLYSFGDGTRFAPVQPPLSRDSGSANAPGATTVHRRNPHAAPPRTFAETRGYAFPFTASQRQYTYGGAAYQRGRGAGSTRVMSRPSRPASRPQRADMPRGSSSLRTAKAVDLGRLHCTQRSHQRTIEEVMADQPQRYLCDAEGLRGALVRDIERDLEDGKLQWGEVPPAMQKAMVSARTADAAVAQRRKPETLVDAPVSSILSASGQRLNRVESLAVAPSALGSVMGQLRAVPAITAASGGEPGARGGAAAKTVSTAPPSPAAQAARATSPESMTGAAANTSRRIPVGAVAAEASLPAISRLNFTPRPTQRSNPSAFV